VKKLLTLLLAAVAVCGAQQVPQTPNLKLNLPPHGYPNWDTDLNQNFNWESASSEFNPEVRIG
jgi:hypothetical protein